MKPQVTEESRVDAQAQMQALHRARAAKGGLAYLTAFFDGHGHNPRSQAALDALRELVEAQS